LVAHPHITLDDFAAVYSSTFFVQWNYDPSNVVITTGTSGDGVPQIITNPVFEEHIRQLHNWTVGDAFRKRFPAIALLIDEDTKRH
jgi:hypothetical protein